MSHKLSNKGTVAIRCMLGIEDKMRLDRYCEKNEITNSQVIRRALKRELKRGKVK